MFTIRKIFLLYILLFLCNACAANVHDINSEPKNNIDVEITTNLGDQQIYVEGDHISFLVSISDDAYLLIVYEDAEKNVWQLLPNDVNQQSKFGAGIYIPIPGAEQAYRFRASAPFGQESLLVFASSTPFSNLKSSQTRNSMRLLDTTIEQLKILLSARNPKLTSNVSMSTLTITTKSKDRNF